MPAYPVAPPLGPRTTSAHRDRDITDPFPHPAHTSRGAPQDTATTALHSPKAHAPTNKTPPPRGASKCRGVTLRGAKGVAPRTMAAKSVDRAATRVSPQVSRRVSTRAGSGSRSGRRGSNSSTDCTLPIAVRRALVSPAWALLQARRASNRVNGPLRALPPFFFPSPVSSPAPGPAPARVGLGATARPNLPSVRRSSGIGMGSGGGRGKGASLPTRDAGVGVNTWALAVRAPAPAVWSARAPAPSPVPGPAPRLGRGGTATAPPTRPSGFVAPRGREESPPPAVGGTPGGKPGG
jgi:hypothetical protein